MQGWQRAFDFQTENNATLDAMLAAAVNFSQEVEAAAPDAKGRWLTLLGKSGIGKTHLARAVFKRLKNFRYYDHPQLGISQAHAMSFIDWRELADQLRNGEHYRVDAIAKAWVVVVDDIGSEYDPSGFLASRLDRIVNARLGKWTIFTSNLLLAEVADRLDSRIADRMGRAENRVFEAETESYTMKKRDK